MKSNTGGTRPHRQALQPSFARYFNIQTDAEGVGTIFLYGDIGDYYDVQSVRVAKELMEAEKASRRVNVRINSNGGEVYCGIAIYNAIKNSKADVRIYVDGIAASMASVIALCGKPVEMSKYARLMLHSVSGGCYGNKNDIQKCIEEIESLEDSLADIYSERTGMTKDEVKATYFDGEDPTGIPPRDKHIFGTTVVGARGQVVIPKAARDMLELKEGDRLVVLGDSSPENRGIALIHADSFLQAAKEVYDMFYPKQEGKP